MTKRIFAALAASVLTACGVETAATAASGAAIKKQEMEQAQKTLQQAQEEIDAAVQNMHQRADAAGQ
jgi:peptidoglycan hydrolase CwlO-like protein